MNIVETEREYLKAIERVATIIEAIAADDYPDDEEERALAVEQYAQDAIDDIKRLVGGVT